MSFFLGCISQIYPNELCRVGQEEFSCVQQNIPRNMQEDLGISRKVHAKFSSLKKVFKNTSLNQWQCSTTVSIHTLLQGPSQLPYLINNTNTRTLLNHGQHGPHVASRFHCVSSISNFTIVLIPINISDNMLVERQVFTEVSRRLSAPSFSGFTTPIKAYQILHGYSFRMHWTATNFCLHFADLHWCPFEEWCK